MAFFAVRCERDSGDDDEFSASPLREDTYPNDKRNTIKLITKKPIE